MWVLQGFNVTDNLDNSTEWTLEVNQTTEIMRSHKVCRSSNNYEMAAFKMNGSHSQLMFNMNQHTPAIISIQMKCNVIFFFKQLIKLVYHINIQLKKNVFFYGSF